MPLQQRQSKLPIFIFIVGFIVLFFIAFKPDDFTCVKPEIVTSMTFYKNADRFNTQENKLRCGFNCQEDQHLILATCNRNDTTISEWDCLIPLPKGLMISKAVIECGTCLDDRYIKKNQCELIVELSYGNLLNDPVEPLIVLSKNVEVLSSNSFYFFYHDYLVYVILIVIVSGCFTYMCKSKKSHQPEELPMTSIDQIVTEPPTYQDV